MLPLKVTAAIILAHILTGTASVSTRYLVAFLEPVEIAFLRYLLGSALIAIAFLCLPRSRITEPFLLKSVLLGIWFFALFPFLFSMAFDYTTAARGALVIATMPIWTMLISHFLKHEKITALLASAIFLSLLGLTIALLDRLLAAGDSIIAIKGEIIMLLCAMVGGSYSVMAKQQLKTIPPLTYTPLMMVSGCMTLSIWAADTQLVHSLQNFSQQQLLVLLYLGTFAGGVAFFLFNWVLHRTSATYTTLFVSLNPLTAIFLGWLLLGEQMTPKFLLGSVIVFVGLYLGYRSQTQKQAAN